MKSIRTIICFLIIFCTVFLLASCGEKKKNNIDDIFSELIENTDESSEKTEETTSAIHVYVIISRDCSGELSLKAKELAEKIEKKTGLLTSVKYDNELASVPNNSSEVLVGSTNRLASKNAMDILKNDEYLCRWDDEAIVICGRSDAATIVAIDKFISDILPTSSKDSLMARDAGFEFKTEYEVKSVTFNGYDLYDYVLTYEASNKCGEKEIAIAVRDFINSKSGYLLDVISNSDITSKTRRIISISGAKQENALFSSDNEISLHGKNSYMLSLVAVKFMKDFESAIKDNAINLKYDTKMCIDDVNTSFESAFCFTKENADVPFTPVYNLIALLKSGSLGICFIGNPDDALREDFLSNIKEPIKAQEVSLGERSVMIAYDEGKVKQINVTVDSSKSYFTAEVETAFGEKISYIYIISGEIPSINDNVVVFHEKHGKIDDGALVSIVGGKETLALGELEYLLARDKNISVKNSDKIIQNDESVFYLIAKTEINYARGFLDYTLK